MIILQILVMLVPALIALLLYERFKGYELVLQKRVMLLLIFAFLINMVVYAVMWVRGWDNPSWTAEGEATVIATSFVLQYMLISLVSGVGFAFVLSLVRVGKRND
jgi:hypothetical protein